LLYRELGVVDAVRFLRQFTTRHGDYTQERDALFADKRLEEIFSRSRFFQKRSVAFSQTFKVGETLKVFGSRG